MEPNTADCMGICFRYVVYKEFKLTAQLFNILIRYIITRFPHGSQRPRYNGVEVYNFFFRVLFSFIFCKIELNTNECRETGTHFKQKYQRHVTVNGKYPIPQNPHLFLWMGFFFYRALVGELLYITI